MVKSNVSFLYNAQNSYSVKKESVVFNNPSKVFLLIHYQKYFLPAARRRSVIWYESCKWLLCLIIINSQSCWSYIISNEYFLYTQFKIIDGVKYVYCIKHAYISSKGTSRVCGRSLTLASMCFMLTLNESNNIPVLMPTTC